MKVSIIVPAYNEEGVITDCINSLLKQDYPKNLYEIIIINDGSTDSTGNIVQAITETNHQVILLSKNNGGKGSAQNLGLRYVKGELILVTDADAIVPQNWVSRMAETLRTADMVVGGYHLYLKDKVSVLEKIQNSSYLIQHKYGGYKGIPRTGVNFGFKKNIIEKIGGFNEYSKSVTKDYIKRTLDGGFTVRYEPSIVVQTIGITSLEGFIKQKLRWREGLLDVLIGKTKLSKSNISGLFYTHGLSLIFFLLTIMAIVVFDFRYFLYSFILILLLDIILYLKPLCRMWRATKERYYVGYFVLYSIFMMLIRFILFPYLLFRLIKGTKPTFKAQRS